ncbi:MAG: ATP-binding protein [Candidatus Krumholzibacteria bacterium]|nr:ATP-binding protein [Candidatus Krumholzibacteria bacterium]
MLRNGMEMMFTGEAGTVTYLFLFLILALAVLHRTLEATDGRGRGALAGLASALLLLFGARALGLTAGPGAGAARAVVSAAAGLAGFYLLATAIGAGRREGDYSALSPPIAGSAALAAVVLGGGALALAPHPGGPAAAGCILIAAAPAGIAAGYLRERRRARSGESPLAGIAVLMLAAATAGAALFQAWRPLDTALWIQTIALLDVTALFVLLAASRTPAAAPADYLEIASGAGPGGTDGQPDDQPGGARPLDISRTIVSGRKSNAVYRDIVRAVSRETGAGFALVLGTCEGDDRLEALGFALAGAAAPPPAFGMQLDAERLNRNCTAGSPRRGVWLFGRDELGEDRDAYVPKILAGRPGRIAVAPVREGRVVRGVLVAGFFGEQVSDAVIEAISSYAHCVLHVSSRDAERARMRSREKDLAVCRAELESVNRLKSNFLSVVSHELRTPLTSIKAYAETLQDNIETVDRETARDFLRVMTEENDRVIGLVDNMLSFACMENGHLKVEKTACDLGVLIEEAVASMEKSLLDGQVIGEVKLPRARVVVEADRELMRQMIGNLVSNAIKFTPRGGTVTVSLEQEASAARIVVQDTGKGIPEEQLEKIFERFHQVDASDTREHGGSGLGLAIVKNIVDWHDGSIWVENVKEAGARFVVMLPMKDIVVRQAPVSGAIGSVRFERERYLSLLVEMLSEFLQARKASIMLLDPERRVLQIAAAKGLDPEFVQNTIVEIGDRIAGRVFLEETTLQVFDIERDGKVARSNNSAYYGTKSFISTPLRDGDEVIGVLNVSDHVDQREFTDADCGILEALGVMISGMIKKLEAYETVSANFEKLKNSMKSILLIRGMWGSRNVVNLTLVALAVGRRLSLDEKSLTALRLGMNLYDLGMMRVPRASRVKKEELTAKERDTLREHPVLGYLLASPMGLDERIMRMIRSHHENFDGSGYPEGLMRDEIPIEARIINVVDSFRALISPGPYRRCYTIDEARNEIIRGAGTKFDPKVVGAFVKVLHELGVREDRCELELAAVERELEEKRKVTEEVLVSAKEDGA